MYLLSAEIHVAQRVVNVNMTTIYIEYAEPRSANILNLDQTVQMSG